MALLVQKFGGTSVGSVARIEAVADKIAGFIAAGHSIVAVVSAMSGETNRLISMAHDIQETPAARELDALLATGEQVSSALLAMALQQRGITAKSYTGGQVRLLTDGTHGKARILAVDEKNIQADIARGSVVIVAGFQGVDSAGNITTLGRGGSDTTAVALAAVLKADECQIYTDVDGVYTTDPRVVSNARRLARITFEEMLEMASLGSKVLQLRAVEFAGKYAVPLRVLSSFEDGPGTLISLDEGTSMETALVSGIAFQRDEAKISILGIADEPGVAYKILGPISDANINVDVIVQNIAANGNNDLTFTVHKDDMKQAADIVRAVAKTLNAREVVTDDQVCKVSLVGVGMRSHAGIASTMFKALADEMINIQLITTSEIKISVVFDEKYMELAVRTLHAAFGLEKEPEI